MVHLRRDFQAMIDRGGEAGEVGQRLMEHSDALFEWWHRLRDGGLVRSSFQTYVATMRPFLREDLERGAACACPKTAGTCRELLSGETHLWTFVRVAGVEPTNNDAERALRHGVIYRKLSGGTDSESRTPEARRRSLPQVTQTLCPCPDELYFRARSQTFGSKKRPLMTALGPAVLVTRNWT
jgi:Transposase IS66 family